MGIYNIADYRIGSPANRVISFSLLSASGGGFQPIDIDTLPALTIHLNALNGLTASAGNITGWINSAPDRFRVLISASPPITSSAGFGVIVPYFTGSDAPARYFTDDNGVGGNLTLSSSISSSGEFHCFAAIYLHQTGSDGTAVNQHSLMGNSSGHVDMASFEASGARITSNDGSAKMTQYIPYSIKTKYVLETFKTANGMMSMSFNGGPVVGSGAVGILNAAALNTSYLIGSSRGLAGTSLEGEIAEFVMLSKSIDSITAQQIRLTLGQRWGITSL